MTRTNRFQMGSWKVEPALNRISGPQGSFRLEPKVMAALCLLADAAGEPVKKRTMMDSIWGGDAIHDGALKHVIWELRRVLSDDAKQPRYIETLPRIGYRLVADVSTVPTRKNRSLWLFLSGLALVVSVTFVFWLSRSNAKNRDHLLRPMLSTPLTSYHGLEIDPAVAPNGHSVVFSRSSNGQYDLFFHNRLENRTERLTHLEGDETLPRWSADGKTVFFLYRPSKGNLDQIWRVNPASLQAEPLSWQPRGVVVGFDCAPDGRKLAVSLRREGDRSARLCLVQLNNGREQFFEAEAGSWGDRMPRFSPDGKWLAFVRHYSAASGDVWVADLEHTGTRKVTFDHAVIAGIAWDEGSLVVSSDRVLPRALWRVDLDGDEPAWLPITARFPQNPDVSESNSLAYQEVICDLNLIQISPRSGEAASVNFEAMSTKAEFAPSPSPDGRFLAFLSSRDGRAQIWIYDSHQNNTRRLSHLERGAVNHIAWHPDSKHLLFDVNIAGRTTLWQMDLKGNRYPAPGKENGSRFLPSWSADGDAFFFTGRVGSDWQIFRQEPGSNAHIQLTEHGGMMPKQHWLSGRLYFAGREGGIWTLAEEDGKARQVIGALAPEDSLNWAVFDQGIVYAAQRPRRIVLFDFATQSERVLYQLDFLSPYPGIGVSGDGRSVYISKVESFTSDLYVVDPFRP